MRIVRRFIALSEKEVKRACRVQRLSKDVMQSMVAVELPAETGKNGSETVYCFKDPSAPLPLFWK